MNTDEISPKRSLGPLRVPKPEPARGTRKTVTPLSSVETGYGRAGASKQTSTAHSAPQRRPDRVISFAPGVSVGALYDAHAGSDGKEEDDRGYALLPTLTNRRSSQPVPSAPKTNNNNASSGAPARRSTVPGGTSDPRSRVTFASLYAFEDSSEYQQQRDSPPISNHSGTDDGVPSYYLFSQWGKDPAQSNGGTGTNGTTAPHSKPLAKPSTAQRAGGLGTKAMSTIGEYDYFIFEDGPTEVKVNAPSKPAAPVNPPATAPARKPAPQSRYEWNSFIDGPPGKSKNNRATPPPDCAASTIPAGTTALSVFRRTIIKSGLNNRTKEAVAGTTGSTYAIPNAPVSSMIGHPDEPPDDADLNSPSEPHLERVSRLPAGAWSYVILFAKKLQAAREARLREMGVDAEDAVGPEEEVEVEVSQVLDDDGEAMMEPTMSMIFSNNFSDEEEEDGEDEEEYEEDEEDLAPLGTYNSGGFTPQNMPSMFDTARRTTRRRTSKTSRPKARPSQPQTTTAQAPPPQYTQKPPAQYTQGQNAGVQRPFPRINMQAAFMQQQQQQQQQMRQRMNARTGPVTYINFTHTIPPPDPQPNIRGPPLRGRKPPPADFARIYGWRLSDSNWIDSPRGGA